MDWNGLAASALLALVPVVTTIVVFYMRLLIPKIPRVALPLIAALLPYVVSLASNAAAGTSMDPLLAALLGAAATWLREILSTISEHGLRA